MNRDEKLVDTWLYGNHLLRITIPSTDTNVISIPRAQSNQTSDKLKRNLYYIKFPMHRDDFQPFYTNTIQPFLEDSTKQLGISNLKRVVQTFAHNSERINDNIVYYIMFESIVPLCNKLLVYYN